MSKTISLTHDSLYFATRGLQHAGSQIDPSTADVAPVTSDAQTLRRYEKTLGKLSDLLKQYQALVSKDSVSLDAANDNLKSLDELNARQFWLRK
ncbi:MAG: hypothetical protein LBD12_06415 [Clostridiales Family XIII bacterium]|jgi:t-SNARE complex subunit (syntaxin)|nr:hypothetical protein [Clostridiales Family XIII bacterium]